MYLFDMENQLKKAFEEYKEECIDLQVKYIKRSESIIMKAYRGAINSPLISKESLKRFEEEILDAMKSLHLLEFKLEHQLRQI